MDRIEKSVLLRAPLEVVWRAVGDSREFGMWFGAKFAGPFVAGEALQAEIVGTTVDETVAAMQKPHVGVKFEIAVEAVEEGKRLAFRWHVDPVGPMTLVEFVLEEVEGGVLLRLSDSGYEALPEERRAAAYVGNDGGWTLQMGLVEKYVGGGA